MTKIEMKEVDCENKWTYSFNELYGWGNDLFDSEDEAKEMAIEAAKIEGEDSVYIGRTYPVWKMLRSGVDIDNIIENFEECCDDVGFEEPFESFIPKDERLEAEKEINEIVINLIKKHIGYYIPEQKLIDVKTGDIIGN